jgi:TetR/AcrR family transcriptional regulator, mexJK operon transcriptional repressor
MIGNLNSDSTYYIVFYECRGDSMSEREDGHLVGEYPYSPKQERAQQKKKALLESGRVLFLDKGFEHTTAKDIAAHAQVAIGTFYRYFSDKRQLLMCLLEDQLDKFMPPEPSWINSNPEHLLAVVLEEHHTRLESIGLHRILPELLVHDEELAEVVAKAKEKIRERILLGLKKARAHHLTWQDLDLDSVTWAILVLLEQMPEKEARCGQKADYTEIAKMICRLVFPPEVLQQLQAGEIK